MEEDYVTFEQAKLLKEKGFPQDLNLDKWVLDSKLGKPILSSEQIPVYYLKIDTIICLRPSLSLVQKWLREEKNICIVMEPYSFNQEKFTEYSCSAWFGDNFEEIIPFSNSYNEALSAGIDKVLELI